MTSLNSSPIFLFYSPSCCSKPVQLLSAEHNFEGHWGQKQHWTPMTFIKETIQNVFLYVRKSYRFGTT